MPSRDVPGAVEAPRSASTGRRRQLDANIRFGDLVIALSGLLAREEGVRAATAARELVEHGLSVSARAADQSLRYWRQRDVIPGIEFRAEATGGVTLWFADAVEAGA